MAEIRAKGFEVFSRQTRLPRPFWVAYTDPAKDVDVSSHLAGEGLVERGFTYVWCGGALWAVWGVAVGGRW